MQILRDALYGRLHNSWTEGPQQRTTLKTLPPLCESAATYGKSRPTTRLGFRTSQRHPSACRRSQGRPFVRDQRLDDQEVSHRFCGQWGGPNSKLELKGP